MPYEEVTQGKISQREVDEITGGPSSGKWNPPSGTNNPPPTQNPPFGNFLNLNLNQPSTDDAFVAANMTPEQLLAKLTTLGPVAPGPGGGYGSDPYTQNFKEKFKLNPSLELSKQVLDLVATGRGAGLALADLRDTAQQVIAQQGTSQDREKYLHQSEVDRARYEREKAMGGHGPKPPAPPPISDDQLIQDDKKLFGQMRETERLFNAQVNSPILLPGTPWKYQGLQDQNATGAPVDPALQGKIDEAAQGSPPVAPEASAQEDWLASLAGKTTQQILAEGTQGTYTRNGDWKGSWVFVGYKTVKDQYGRTYKQPIYAADTEAYKAIYSMSRKDILQFQKSLGLAETGSASDENTRKAWAELVNETSRRNALGQNVTVDQVYAEVVMANAEARRRSGSGGGGRAGNVDITSAKAILTQAMQEFAGREPSDAEVRVFWRKLQSQWSSTSGNMDPGQFATDYVRATFGQETEGMAYNQYYDAMMSILGGGV